MHKISSHLLKRAFGAQAASYQSKVLPAFSRADLGEFPELNRSFMRVLDS